MFGDKFGKQAQIVCGVGSVRAEKRVVSAVNERQVVNRVRSFGCEQRVGRDRILLEHFYTFAQGLVKIKIGVARIIFKLRRNGIESGGNKRGTPALSDKIKRFAFFGKR